MISAVEAGLLIGLMGFIYGAARAFPSDFYRGLYIYVEVYKITCIHTHAYRVQTSPLIYFQLVALSCLAAPHGPLVHSLLRCGSPESRAAPMKVAITGAVSDNSRGPFRFEGVLVCVSLHTLYVCPFIQNGCLG